MVTIRIDGREMRAEARMGALLLFKEQTGKEATEVTDTTGMLRYCYCCWLSCLEPGEKALDFQAWANKVRTADFNMWCLAFKADADEAEKKTMTAPQ